MCHLWQLLSCTNWWKGQAIWVRRATALIRKSHMEKCLNRLVLNRLLVTSEPHVNKRQTLQSELGPVSSNIPCGSGACKHCFLRKGGPLSQIELMRRAVCFNVPGYSKDYAGEVGH